jgi:hypothetical protein
MIGIAASQTTSFNITAISAANNVARLESLEPSAPPNFGGDAVNFGIGDFDNAFVDIIPSDTTTSAIINAPKPQWSTIDPAYRPQMNHLPSTTEHTIFPDPLIPQDIRSS